MCVHRPVQPLGGAGGVLSTSQCAQLQEGITALRRYDFILSQTKKMCLSMLLEVPEVGGISLGFECFRPCSTLTWSVSIPLLHPPCPCLRAFPLMFASCMSSLQDAIAADWRPVLPPLLPRPALRYLHVSSEFLCG